MSKVYIANARGDRYRGLVPAAPNTSIQSRDAQEVNLRPIYEDATLTDFVIKALSFILSLFSIINRFRSFVAKFEQMITCGLDSADAETSDYTITHAYSNHSDIKGLFCINNLNILHQYQMQQNERHFRQWLKQVISETPSLTATLHGASCGNLLCTYQI